MGWRLGQSYGQDLRDRVLGAEGSLAAVAQRFEVSASYVARARGKLRRTGNPAAGEQRCRLPLRLQRIESELMAQVAQQPDATLAELCEWASIEHGVRVSIACMHKTLRRWGLTLKKRRSTPASSSARTWPASVAAGSSSSPA